MTSGLLASTHYLIPVKAEPLSRYGIDLFMGVVGRRASNYGHRPQFAGVVLTMVEKRSWAYKNTVEFLNNSPQWKDKKFQSDFLKRASITRGQHEQRFALDLGDELRRMIVRITQELRRRVE